MKKSLFKISMFLIIGTISFSCSNDEIDLPIKTENQDGIEILQVNQNDALLFFDKVAPSLSKLELTKEGSKTKSVQEDAQKEIGSIKPIYNGENISYWIINYANNGGYLLLSANKTKFPILGFANSGNYEETSEANQQTATINQFEYNISDTINNSNYRLWMELATCTPEDEFEIEFCSNEELENNKQTKATWDLDPRDYPSNRLSVYPLGYYTLQWECGAPYNFDIAKPMINVEVTPLALGHYLYIAQDLWMYNPDQLSPKINYSTDISKLLKKCSDKLGVAYEKLSGGAMPTWTPRSSVHNVTNILVKDFNFNKGGELLLYRNQQSEFEKVYKELYDGYPVLFFCYTTSNTLFGDRDLYAWVVDGYQEVSVKCTKTKKLLGITISTKTWYEYKDFFHVINYTANRSGWFNQNTTWHSMYPAGTMSPQFCAEYNYIKYALINAREY